MGGKSELFLWPLPDAVVIVVQIRRSGLYKRKKKCPKENILFDFFARELIKALTLIKLFMKRFGLFLD